MDYKHKQVRAIKQGTVIDHIPTGQGIKILKFFHWSNHTQRTTVGLNLPTKNDQGKDLIKLADITFTAEQANQLALFAPKATINTIKDYQVINKFYLTLPKTVSKICQCLNSRCITQSELTNNKFLITERAGIVKLTCFFCEKTFEQGLFPEFDS